MAKPVPPIDARDSIILGKLEEIGGWVVAPFAMYVFLGGFIDLWPMNWVRVPFDLLRHQAFSEVSVVFSGCVCFIGFSVLASALWPRVTQLGLRLAKRFPCLEARLQPVHRPPKAPLKKRQVNVRVGVGLACASWLAAPIVLRYDAWREASDNDAVYRPIAADEPTRRVPPRDAHQHRHGERVLQDDPCALEIRPARSIQRAAESTLVAAGGPRAPPASPRILTGSRT